MLPLCCACRWGVTGEAAQWRGWASFHFRVPCFTLGTCCERASLLPTGPCRARYFLLGHLPRAPLSALDHWLFQHPWITSPESPASNLWLPLVMSRTHAGHRQQPCPAPGLCNVVRHTNVTQGNRHLDKVSNAESISLLLCGKPKALPPFSLL